jgi:RNA polymerase sigma-70 factor (ECF subfamily)
MSHPAGESRPGEVTTDVFEQHRSVLLGVAYRVLGSATDAEDVVQDAWLRWSGADREAVAEPRAYLVTITTRLAIDRLRRAAARRESYVGEWLPEPVSTDPDLAERSELTESVEFALLVVLETLSPLERAVFVLHEAFGLPFGEVAQILDRQEPAVRQLGHRAREHVRARRPRYDVDRAQRREVTERFLAAAATGDLDALSALFAPDVRLLSDSGGNARAPRRTIVGADKVSRFVHAISNQAGAGVFLASIGLPQDAAFEYAIAEVNGAPALTAFVGDQCVVLVSLLIRDGLIEEAYLIANPDKLGAVSRPGGPVPSEGA